MGYRPDIDGFGLALSCDKTSTGARLISSIPLSQVNILGFCIIRMGDKTLPCPACGKPGTVSQGAQTHVRRFMGVQVAVDRCLVSCGCPPGSNRIVAPLGWMGIGPSPEQKAQEKHTAMLAAIAAERKAEAQQRAEERDRNRVFAKSSQRGEGCNDAGETREPHTNFAEMGIFRAAPVVDTVTDTSAPQHAQTAKKKPLAPEVIQKPKKRSALYRWWNGNHEEMDYQAAMTTAAAATRAQAATAGASVLEQLGGRFATYGTWAIRGATGLGEVAAAGAGASVAGVLIGMMPGRLNNGEQDFIDRIRAEQLREAPTRVRFTWENDSQGNPVPQGWHTPPGKDMVRVRKMGWDSRYQAYSFTTEENPRITIVWTPDNSGVKTPSNTGNQARPVLPNPVIVDPLPDNTGITATTTPTPEEKSFADYILILPVPDIPPIYIYLSKPPVEFLDVDLYSNLNRRPRQGMHADHMPSAAAVRAYWKLKYPDAKPAELDTMAKDVAAIVIPADVHQKLSATYGGRNNPEQIGQDSKDLQTAVERDFGSIRPALKERGATDKQLDEAKAKMHTLNQEQGLYDK